MSARNGGERGSRSSSYKADRRFVTAALLSLLLVIYAGFRLIPPREERGLPEGRALVLDLNVARVEFTIRGPLDVNSAAPEELESLPGIGPELARRIVAYREAHGPFRSVEGLLEVPGIGPAILARIRDLITVGEPEPEPPR